MKDLENLTNIELNNLIVKTKDEHESLKLEINNYLTNIERLETLINIKIERLNEVEKNYVKLTEILLSKR